MENNLFNPKEDTYTAKAVKYHGKPGTEVDYLHFTDGKYLDNFTVITVDDDPKTYLTSSIREIADPSKIEVIILKSINGNIEVKKEIFQTNGLPAKAKACKFYEEIKRKFLGESK